MERFIMTKHFTEDRLDRATYIAMNVGFGEPVKEITKTDDLGRVTVEHLTSTGVVIITNEFNEVITMFVASKTRIRNIYGGDIPKWMEQVISKNYKKNHINKQDGA